MGAESTCREQADGRKSGRGGGRHCFAFQQAKEMCLFAERNFLIKVSSLVDVSLCAMAEFSAQVFSDRWRI
jgi:hypothetical protein